MKLDCQKMLHGQGDAIIVLHEIMVADLRVHSNKQHQRVLMEKKHQLLYEVADMKVLLKWRILKGQQLLRIINPMVHQLQK